jgi:hypothetical protein
MKRTFDMYLDKEYVTGVNVKYTFYHFPEGEDRKNTKIEDLEILHEWLVSELQFYDRMCNELRASYYTQKEDFERTHHWYTQEEMHEAALKNRLSVLDLEFSNKRYDEERHRLNGILREYRRIHDKYWKLYRLNEQAKQILRTLKVR